MMSTLRAITTKISADKNLQALGRVISRHAAAAWHQAGVVPGYVGAALQGVIHEKGFENEQGQNPSLMKLSGVAALGGSGAAVIGLTSATLWAPVGVALGGIIIAFGGGLAASGAYENMKAHYRERRDNGKLDAHKAERANILAGNSSRKVIGTPSL